MSIRKSGVVGSFVAGAALALAPMAAAAGGETPDPTDTPDVTDTDQFNDLLVSEVTFMNSLFKLQATLGGVTDDDDVIQAGDPTEDNPLDFSTIDNDDLKANEAFASLLYGPNWADEMSSADVSGSYNLYNGALTQFFDGGNVLMYAMLNDGAQIDVADAGDYLFGNADSIADNLAGDSVWADASNFFQDGFADLGGYFGLGDLF